MTMMRTSDGLSTTINDLATKILKAGMNSKSEKKRRLKNMSQGRLPSLVCFSSLGRLSLVLFQLRYLLGLAGNAKR